MNKKRSKNNGFEATFRALVEAAAEESNVFTLAKAAGVPQSSLSLWLRGERAHLRSDTISKLCDYLGATLECT